MKKTYLLIASVATLAACNKNLPADYTPADENGLVPLVFRASAEGIRMQTEQSKTSVVETLPSFNVLCFKGTESKASASSVWYAEFSGTTVYKAGKYWPSTDEGYHFYASNAAISFDTSGSYIAASEASSDKDVIVAECLEPEYRASNLLEFNHIFARIGTCSLSHPAKYADSNISDFSVKITPYVSGKYLIGEALWSDKTAGTETTLASGLSSTQDKDLWLLPGEYTISVGWTFTEGNFSKTYKRTATVSLVAGKINNISAELPGPADDLKEIEFTVTVTPWESKDVNASWDEEN